MGLSISIRSDLWPNVSIKGWGMNTMKPFFPVIKPITIQILLTLAMTNHWNLQQLDVNNAYLNDILEEEVYMTQPAGFENSNKDLVCKLNKAICGLKQALRAWFENLKSIILSYNFQSSKCDPSFFVYKDSSIVVRCWCM